MHCETLNCPTCGAAVSSDATHCLFCDARLATVACPSCFAMMFTGSKHCSRCGAKAERLESETTGSAPRRCPRCGLAMEAVAVGAVGFDECKRCGGAWVSAAAFEQISADREQQAAVLGAASGTRHGEPCAHPDKVRYVPCPECGQLMNRTNFARCSGVIVDLCKGHGTWFDQEELQQVVEFIRGGGLEVSRRREKQELADERQRLRQEQLTIAMRENHSAGHGEYDGGPGLVSAARQLLRLLRD